LRTMAAPRTRPSGPKTDPAAAVRCRGRLFREEVPLPRTHGNAGP